MNEKAKIIKENETFRLDKFMADNSIKKNNGAIGIITPCQLIFAKAIDSGNSLEVSDHDLTYDLICKFIYDFQIETDEQLEPKLNIAKNQNIFLRMINEQPIPLFGNMKSIFIHYPSTITHTQLEFLKQIEQKYGEALKHVSKKQILPGDDDSLIGFNDLNGKLILDDSFASFINYAEKYLINDNKIIIPDKNILGQTLDVKHIHL